MDPYLEEPAFWPHFHTSLMVYLNAALSQNLPPGFVARVETRVYILPDEREVRPDAIVFATAPSRRPAGGVATLERARPPEVVLRQSEAVEERYLEIRDLRHGAREVIAAIEVLSPANKSEGGAGRREYLRKQKAVLESGTHLLEIDLLRGGQHTVAAPEDAVRACGPWNYLLCLSDATRRDEYLFWRLGLREALPTVDLPLTPDVPPVEIRLQAVFDRCYDEGRLGDDLDYARPPKPPLSGEDAVWAKALSEGF